MPASRVSAPLAALAFLLQLSACGGSSGSSPSSGSPTSSTPSSGGGVSAGNPCGAALGGLPTVAAATATAAATNTSKAGPLGWDDRDPLEFIGLHRQARGKRVLQQAGPPVGADAVATRSGEIAVLNDNGSLVVGANAFDLGGAGLRFEPNGEGGYDVSRTGGEFRPDLGRRLTLGDDATTEEALPFSFGFFGQGRGSVFVNSDGNLTFTRGDVATDDRSLGRVLGGPPRAALFFADLDPTKGGGIFLSASAAAFTVTWCAVPDFDDTGKVTAQASFLPGGGVEMRFDSASTLKDAVVALSPGATADFAALDLSAASAPAAGGTAAVGERFATERSLDLLGAAQQFYTAFGDDYDQLIFWTDTRVTGTDTFAFESTVSNSIQGIGVDQVSFSREYGSGGRLASVVLMDALAKYPSDPLARVNGENTPMSLVAHETGHRWGATLRFRDGSGSSTDIWLGRQRAHWGFFTNSEASVLEGNAIADQAGTFSTGTPSLRYSPFDLYAMGLMGEAEVPATFYVDNPVITGSTSASFNRESAPRSGITMTGTRRDVTIQAVVQAMGARNPVAGGGPYHHRQAWVYVVSAGTTADGAALAKLETFRQAFEGFFEEATGGRMTVDTRLD